MNPCLKLSGRGKWRLSGDVIQSDLIPCPLDANIVEVTLTMGDESQAHVPMFWNDSKDRAVNKSSMRKRRRSKVRGDGHSRRSNRRDLERQKKIMFNLNFNFYSSMKANVLKESISATPALYRQWLKTGVCDPSSQMVEPKDWGVRGQPHFCKDLRLT